jgi:hypothetical protein
MNAARRHVEQRFDQAWTLTTRRLAASRPVAPFDGEPRLGIVTVNASTTRYLKLMLLTLAEQQGLELLEQIVIVDNRSRDGGTAFLEELTERVPRVVLVRRRWFCSHARGMRVGERALDPAVNIVLYCDPDVVWRNSETLLDLAAAIVAHDAALAGEVRRAHSDDQDANPDIQASFLAVRRDALHQRDVRPPVNHGSPTLWLQQDVVRAGLPVVHFPSNHGGYVLHRGRSAVAASREFTPRRSYATATYREPHYMGVPDGATIWDAVETHYADLLTRDAEPQLVEELGRRLGTVRP